MFVRDAAARRFICRAVFCAACAAPTALLLAVILFLQTPWYRQWRVGRWERLLSAATGVRVRLAAVDRNSRGDWLLLGCELADPETGAIMAKARSVEIDDHPEGPAVRLAQPELESDGLNRLFALLHEHLLRRPSAHRRVTITASELTLRAGEPRGTLFDFTGCWDTADAVSQWTCEFRLTTDARHRGGFRIERRRASDGAQTAWVLQTGGAPLPCGLAACFLPVLADLGPGTTFQGTVAMRTRDEGWDGELSGQINDLELDRLITDRFAHKLSGLARLSLDYVRIERGWLREATGSLQARDGVISRSLINAAIASLGMTGARGNAEYDGAGLTRYRRLALGFSWQDTDLTLVPPADGPAPAAVLLDDRGPLLTLPQPHSQAGLALVRLLAPGSEFEVPATETTARLLRFLPAPPVVWAQRPSDQTYVPLRLRQAPSPGSQR